MVVGRLQLVKAQAVVVVGELQRRKQQRGAGGSGSRRSDGEHDHDLVLCRDDGIAAAEDLPREHAGDRDQASDAEHVDDGRERSL